MGTGILSAGSHDLLVAQDGLLVCCMIQELLTKGECKLRDWKSFSCVTIGGCSWPYTVLLSGRPEQNLDAVAGRTPGRILVLRC